MVCGKKEKQTEERLKTGQGNKKVQFIHENILPAETSSHG